MDVKMLIDGRHRDGAQPLEFEAGREQIPL